jgi:hypothetical protein
MNNQKQTKEIIAVGKYEIHIRELTNSRFNYGVELRQLTPKAKYMPYKIIFNYGFSTYEEAVNCADNHKQRAVDILERLDKIKIERANRRQKNKVEAKEFYKIGDIVVNTWGYEQTNVGFFQVVDITARTIKIKEIDSKIFQDSMYAHGMACEVVAINDSFVENGEEYKLIVKKDGLLSKAERFYYFTKWQGTPIYKSWYA